MKVHHVGADAFEAVRRSPALRSNRAVSRLLDSATARLGRPPASIDDFSHDELFRLEAAVDGVPMMGRSHRGLAPGVAEAKRDLERLRGGSTTYPWGASVRIDSQTGAATVMPARRVPREVRDALGQLRKFKRSAPATPASPSQMVNKVMKSLAAAGPTGRAVVADYERRLAARGIATRSGRQPAPVARKAPVKSSAVDRARAEIRRQAAVLIQSRSGR